MEAKKFFLTICVTVCCGTVSLPVWANSGGPSATAGATAGVAVTSNNANISAPTLAPSSDAAVSSSQMTQIDSHPIGFGQGGSASAGNWNYAPSSSVLFLDQSRNNSPSYGTIGFGRPQSPVGGSYTPITPIRGRYNLKPSADTVRWQMPEFFTQKSWGNFKRSVIEARGEEYWEKLENAFRPGHGEKSAIFSPEILVDWENLPKIEGVRSIAMEDFAPARLLPGRDYRRAGGVQVDALEDDVRRQYLVIFAAKYALDHNIPVILTQGDVHLRAGTRKEINNTAWAIGLGALFPGNTPIMVGPGYGKTGTTEVARETVYAGTDMAFLIPKDPEHFWEEVYGALAARHGMKIAGKKTPKNNMKEKVPVTELAK